MNCATFYSGRRLATKGYRRSLAATDASDFGYQRCTRCRCFEAASSAIESPDKAARINTAVASPTTSSSFAWVLKGLLENPGSHVGVQAVEAAAPKPLNALRPDLLCLGVNNTGRLRPRSTRSARQMCQKLPW